MSLTKLMKQLQAFESMIKSKGIEANLTKAGNSSKPSNRKGKKFKQVASKTYSIPSAEKKVKKKKKRTRRKLSALLAGR